MTEEGQRLPKDRRPKKIQKKPVHFYKQKKKVDADQIEIISLQALCSQFDASQVKTFDDFPLSKRLQKALKEYNFSVPTPIQKESIGLALKGHDILGAAKTGSGKTLAFLIPVLELLYKLKWSAMDGLGALIITPTRELAYQIFEVLKKIGKYHECSAGLIIGGKDLKFERKRLDRCNIIMCTPGRLLQHLDENPLLGCTNLQMLVLDEADRILDLGFQKTMNAILEHLPSTRQSLLFSATQTRSVKDLARLSLKDPVYVSVHEHAMHSTPQGLQQSYIVCELHDKIDMLWSFLKHHLKQKILVFMSSCKQVKFMYEVFCRMRPGISVLALYGSMHQMRRMAVYDDFCQKQSAVLFATDIAARGLDFPSIHWVIQLDCPEDANTYIHRAGRTARYEHDGEALLILLPSEEEAMVAQLNQKKIPITKIQVNPKKQRTVQRKIEALLARDSVLKESAQRAFVSYFKAVFLMKDKDVFDIQKLNSDEYARSLGLATAPRIRFLQKHQKQLENVKKSKSSETTSESNRTMNADLSANTDSNLRQPYNFSVDESDEELFTVKRTLLPIEEEIITDTEPVLKEQHKKPVTKAAIAKKLLKKKIKPNIHRIFDEVGEEVRKSLPREQISEYAKATTTDEGGINIEIAKNIMAEEDKYDKQLHREHVKAMHKVK